MFEDLKQNVRDWDEEIEKGLIYGIGHAVYSISDPRCILLKEQAEKLAKEKCMTGWKDWLLKLSEEFVKCIRVLVPTWISTQVLFIKC